MKRILSLFLALASLVCMCTFLSVESAAAAEPDELVLQDIEYKELIGRVNQNDSGWTQGSTSIWAGPNTGSRNDSGWQFYYIDIGAYSENARPNSGNVDRDLDESFLDSLRGTLTNLRKNGGNCLIRVTYSIDGRVNCEPSTFDQLMVHQQQLASVFKDFPDVIALIECGMIGAFGEMWGGLYDDASSKRAVLEGWLSQLPEEITLNVRTAGEYYNYVFTSDLYKNVYRNKVVDGIKYPPSINDKNFSDYPFMNTVFSRIGCYNDAMIQDGNDGGSFSGGRDKFMNWLTWKAEVTNYGGEFSGADWYRVSSSIWLPMRAIPEMYVSHLSYYHGGNAAYNSTGRFKGTYNAELTKPAKYNTREAAEAAITNFEDMILTHGGDMKFETQLTENSDGTFSVARITHGWQSATMTEELYDKIYEVNDPEADLKDYFQQPVSQFFEDHVGYRHVLRSSYLSKSVARGGVLKVKGTIDNVGFANITRKKAVEIIVTDGDNTYVVPTDLDARDWDGATRTEYDLQIKLPSGIPAGEYEVFLRAAGRLPDGTTNAANGVRFCNPGEYSYYVQGSTFAVGANTVNIIYNSDLGANYLGGFTVTEDVISGSDDTAKQVYTEFTDVADDHWGKEYIANICEYGYMGGIGSGKFDPDGIATRAQFVTVLYKMEGQPAVKNVATPFSDIAGWYNAAIKWAYSEGIVNGTSATTFSPETELNRETFATMLYRYAEYKGVDVASVAGDLGKYIDEDKVSSWALTAMKWANAKGYIGGMTADTLVPQGKANRAQMATIMVRYLSDN